MEIVKPFGIISGFHAHLPCSQVPYLRFLGEQWAPESYAITKHSHPVWEFYLQLDGWSTWRTQNGDAFRCEPGTFFAPPPNLEHWLDATSPTKHHFLFAAIDTVRLSQERFPEMSEIWSGTSPIHIAEAFACESSFRELAREATSDRLFRDTRLQAILDSLIIEVARLISSTQAKSLLAKHPAVETARSAIEQHPGAPWLLKDLGRIAGMSPNHLSHLFTTEFGVTPHQFLMRTRMSRAQERLKNNQETIAQIAQDLGFHSGQHFARVFKQMTGKTPKSIREN
jgi:AraC family transcriptional regulator